jgi:hypothetical protein
MAELIMGRALQFDQARGYGCVATDDGSENIFQHAPASGQQILEVRQGFPECARKHGLGGHLTRGTIPRRIHRRNK